jgi:hypothetical protein
VNLGLVWFLEIWYRKELLHSSFKIACRFYRLLFIVWSFCLCECWVGLIFWNLITEKISCSVHSQWHVVFMDFGCFLFGAWFVIWWDYSCYFMLSH